MAEVSSINVKSIVDTAVTQFKTAIQEVLTSEVARVQGLLGAAQREEAAIRERFASGEAQITERTAYLATLETTIRGREEYLAELEGAIAGLQTERQATERAHAAAKAAYHAVAP